MPLAAKPVGAAHNGVHTAVPSDETQPAWPVASKAYTELAPFAKTLFPSTTGGVAGPLLLPRSARKTGAQVSSAALQWRTPSTSKPSRTGFDAPATTTKTVPDGPWIAGAPPAVAPDGITADHTTP